MYVLNKCEGSHFLTVVRVDLKTRLASSALKLNICDHFCQICY